MTIPSRILVDGKRLTKGGKLRRCKGCGAMVRFGMDEDGNYVPYENLGMGQMVNHLTRCRAIVEGGVA